MAGGKSKHSYDIGLAIAIAIATAFKRFERIGTIDLLLCIAGGVYGWDKRLTSP